MIRSNLFRPVKFAICKYQAHETKVEKGLSTTPAQMWDLASQGKPIGSYMLSDDLFYDGDPYQTYDVPLDRQRGIDINDMWNAQENLKKKFHKFSEQDQRVIQFHLF